MAFFGKKSGFKNARDLLLTLSGLAICFFHLITTKPTELSYPVLIFGAGLAGIPYPLSKDEKTKEDA